MTAESTRVWRKGLSVCAAAVFAVAIAASAQSSDTAARAMNSSDSARPTANSSDATPPANVVDPTKDYVIGPGDVLSITVFNEPEVTGVGGLKVPVRPDGMITVPLVGEVDAGGLTPDRLQSAITQKLSEYVKQPSVTVVVEEMNSRQFNVLGKVQHPGSFPLSKPTRVLDALAQAGGFTEFAKANKVYVLRRDPSGSTTRLAFNYKRVSQGDDDQENIQLQAGDTVIVP